jgi:hypothetical protein
MKLIKLVEASSLLNLSTKAAKAQLFEWNVQCIDTGPGRGRGLRWNEDDILNEIESRMRPPLAPPNSQGHKKTRKDFRISGRKASEILSEMNSSGRGQ